MLPYFRDSNQSRPQIEPTKKERKEFPIKESQIFKAMLKTASVHANNENDWNTEYKLKDQDSSERSYGSEIL